MKLTQLKTLAEAARPLAEAKAEHGLPFRTLPALFITDAGETGAEVFETDAARAAWLRGEILAKIAESRADSAKMVKRGTAKDPMRRQPAEIKAAADESDRDMAALEARLAKAKTSKSLALLLDSVSGRDHELGFVNVYSEGAAPVAEGAPARGETASQAYDRVRAAIEQKLDAIGTELEAHHAAQKNRDKDWGFHGNLGYIDTKLGEILSFLKGND